MESNEYEQVQLNSTPNLPEEDSIKFPGFDNSNTDDGVDRNYNEEPKFKAEEIVIEDGSEKDNYQPQEHFESEVHRQSRRDPAKARINQLTRERYQALDALEKIQQENEVLKQQSMLNSQAASKAYDEAVLSKLERARRIQVDAIESGDTQAQADANLALSLAASEYKQNEDWKSEQSYQTQYQPQQRQDTVASREYSIVNWFNQRSPNLDGNAREALRDYSDRLDSYLTNSGNEHLIGTNQYIQELDYQIEQYMDNYQAPGNNMKQSRQLNMNPSRQSVAPVRGGYSDSPMRRSDGKISVSLSSDDKDMAKRLKVSEKEYARYKLSNQMNTKERGR